MGRDRDSYGVCASNAGDDMEIALTSETAGRVTFTSLVTRALDATFETHDGGRTWTKL
jgi:hypothetical protein